MLVKQSKPHLLLSNINDMYANAGKYIIRVFIIYFVQSPINKSKIQFTFYLKEKHGEFCEWVIKPLLI